MSGLNELKSALNLSVTKKKHRERSAAIAYSSSGKKYKAGMIESDTHLLNIAPEQLALAFSAQNNDFKVNKVIALAEAPKRGELVSPITAKVLIDHARRTGEKIEYQITDLNGRTLFQIKDVRKLFGKIYAPAECLLSKVEGEKISPNKAKLKKGEKIENALKAYALKGMERNFPTSDAASGYGAAVLTRKGNLYFGGQYSSFEKRTNLHSEVAVVARALMEKDGQITHLGLVSSKFENEPCQMCGSCRQFLAEINRHFGLDIQIHLFSKNAGRSEKVRIKEFLPNQWTSKKWQNSSSR